MDKIPDFMGRDSHSCKFITVLDPRNMLLQQLEHNLCLRKNITTTSSALLLDQLPIALLLAPKKNASKYI